MTTLKSLREECKKSRAEIATTLGVTVSAFGHYEQGSRRIDIEQVLVLSELYNVSSEEIIHAQLNSCQLCRVNNQK